MPRGEDTLRNPPMVDEYHLRPQTEFGVYDSGLSFSSEITFFLSFFCSQEIHEILSTNTICPGSKIGGGRRRILDGQYSF